MTTTINTDDSVLSELATRWASVYGLRHVPADNRYRGIIDGVCVEVAVVDQTLQALFFSPTGSLISQIASDFAGFTNLARSGVALTSLTGLISRRPDDLGSCVLTLSIPQLLAVGPDKFDEIPALVVKDFHQFGTAANAMICKLCQAPSPTQLVQYDEQYHVICDNCFQTFQQRAMENPTAAAKPTVNWKKALPTMLITMVIGGVVWGVLQHQAFRLPFYFLVALPGIGVMAHARFAARAAHGMNRQLLVAIVATSVIAIVIGNVIGFAFALAALKVRATWWEILRTYFEHYLPANWQEEALYFVGGLIGIYFAWAAHKPKTQGEIVQRL